MKYAIVYTSKTGNTGVLAEKIKELLPKEAGIFFGAPSEVVLEAETFFVGFWTDKGNCNEEIGAFLESLHGKKVFLFGSAGFGGSETYFNEILGRVKDHLPEDNTVIGSFMCQGKMPMAVRHRYEMLVETMGQKAKDMIRNFDEALSHPNGADFLALEEAVQAMG